MHKLVIVLVSVVVVSAGLFASVLPANATTPPSWKVVASPHPAGPLTTSLHGIACPSDTSCFAVGNTSGPGVVEHWNGSSWSFTQLAKPPAVTLDAISCPSTTSCFVVGQIDSGAQMVEHWNGSAWSTQTVPQPSGESYGALNGVWCVTGTDCFAVGYWENHSDVSKTLVERWNGSKWSIVSSPNPSAARNEFFSVRCTSSTNCWGVGEYVGGEPFPMIERWNGASWAIVASDDPGGAVSASFAGVSCNTATSCYAVGQWSSSSATRNLVEHWSGSLWSIVTVADPVSSTASALSAVVCPSSTVCFAVGDDTLSTVNPLVDRLSGSTWSAVSPPEPAGADSEVLNAIACRSTSSCFAAGLNSGASAVTERWNGASWSLGAPPAGSSESSLHSVACWSTDGCFAVGVADPPSEDQVALAERWNGSSWTSVGIDSPSGSIDTQLDGVVCPSSSNCLTVGFSLGGSGVRSLAEHWNGAHWTIDSTPTPGGATFVLLDGLGCASASDCFAVGTYESASVDKVLIDRWNGSTWSLDSAPLPAGASGSGLDAVKCVSATSCLAVGSYEESGTYHTLSERWNGSSWSIVVSASPPGAIDLDLADISCGSSTQCIAAGSFEDSGGPEKTLTLRWNGSSWSIATSPNPGGATSTYLEGVKCAAVSNCLAVGDFTKGSIDKTLTEHWNGTAWSIVGSADPPGATTSQFLGLSCPAASVCIGVGDYMTPTHEDPLTERYS